MFRKIAFITISTVILSALFFAGCGESEKINLNFQPDSSVSYIYSEENIKQVKFERPSENEVSDKVTKSTYTIAYDQKTVEVTEDGSVIADIELKKIAYSSQSPKNATNSFDSDTEPNAEMSKLIGQSYRIKISPMGVATVVQPLDISVVSGGSTRQTAQRLFSNDQIEKRHTIEPLAKKPDDVKLKTGATWSITEPSPKGMMNSKNYEKIYTLKSVEDGMVKIDMKTIPGSGQAGAGMFAMFGNEIQADFDDIYKGKLKYSAADGKVVKYSEELDATWTAVDNSKKDVEVPDTLIIRFAKNFSLEATE